MKRIYAYFINITLLAFSLTAAGADTLYFPLKIRIGADLFGPVYRLADNNIHSFEGILTIDRDTTAAYILSAGHQKYTYSRYNYDYRSKGFFIKLGIELNALSPFMSKGKYFAGGSVKYGAALYKSEAPFITSENYWGTVERSIDPITRVAHFLEASPGVRAEVFPNFVIGWSLHLRLLIHSGFSRNLRPVYIPGYGNGTKSFSPGLSYYLIWSIPFRTERIIR